MFSFLKKKDSDVKNLGNEEKLIIYYIDQLYRLSYIYSSLYHELEYLETSIMNYLNNLDNEILNKPINKDEFIQKVLRSLKSLFDNVKSKIEFYKIDIDKTPKLKEALSKLLDLINKIEKGNITYYQLSFLVRKLYIDSGKQYNKIVNNLKKFRDFVEAVMNEA